MAPNSTPLDLIPLVGDYLFNEKSSGGWKGKLIAGVALFLFLLWANHLIKKREKEALAARSRASADRIQTLLQLLKEKGELLEHEREEKEREGWEAYNEATEAGLAAQEELDRLDDLRGVLHSIEEGDWEGLEKWSKLLP